MSKIMFELEPSLKRKLKAKAELEMTSISEILREEVVNYVTVREETSTKDGFLKIMFELDDELKLDFKAKAKKDNFTMSQVLRMRIQDLVRENGSQGKQKKKLKKTKKSA